MQKLQKISQIFYAAFCSEFALKNFKSPKNRISAIFAEILPPPLWESQNFEKKFHFRGRSTSEFSLNWEGFSNFHTISVAFSKSHFFELSVTFFSPISLNFLQKLQEFLQFGGWTNDQTSVPRIAVSADNNEHFFEQKDKKSAPSDISEKPKKRYSVTLTVTFVPCWA